METLDLKKFIPKRNYAKKDQLYPQDWADLIIEFHVFCMEVLQEYRSSKDMRLSSADRIHGLLCYSQNNDYQRINLKNIDYPQGISGETPLITLACFELSLFTGRTRKIVISENGNLLLCEAHFGEATKERDGKDDVYYALSCTINSVDATLLAKELTRYNGEKSPANYAQEILKSLYKLVVSEVKKTNEEKALMETENFKNSFGDEIIAMYAN